MKKTVLFITVGLSLTFVGCRKKDTNNVTPTNNTTTTTTTTTSTTTATKTGTIQFVNNSENPYELYLNGKYKGVAMGKKVVSYNVEEGYYTCRVLQQSGYVLYPTDKSYTGTLSASKILVVSFP